MTAKIKLNAASGGGSFSLQAPSSSANNRVLTLPDAADGIVAQTDSSGNFTVSGNLKAGTITDTSGNNSSTTAQIAQGRAKAWIRYGIDGSGVTVLDSFGISGTSDNGTGDVIITFSTAMANDDYCWSFISGSGMWNGVNSYATTTTLRLLIMTRNDSYTNADDTCNACVIFGDQ